MIKPQYLLLIACLFLLIIPLFPTIVTGLVTNSTLVWFNVTNVTYFNWTTSNITIGALNGSDIQIYVDNKTTFLAPNYSQVSETIRSDYTTGVWSTCFPQWAVGNTNYNLSFLVQNQTETYTNITGNLSTGDIENITLSIHSVCPPGKYSGYFRVYRANDTSDNATVDAVVVIPITADNTLNTTYYNASFRGTMAINDSYHSFYFNATELTENVTNLTIALTELDDDVDIFLFDDSSNLQGRSIEKNTNDESIMDISLPTSPAMWEIRVYGNVSTPSSYIGYIYYSTLNITNITYPYETVSSLNFGDLDPNTTYPTTWKNYTLKNEDDRVLSNVNEYSEVYHVDTWTSENTEKDFVNLLVPNFTQKMKVKIEWSNVTDWNLYLTDPSGRLIGSSLNKFANSNKTNATREEFIVFSGPFNSTNEGFWNISVRNVTNTTIQSNYNVTVYLWIDASSLVSSNYLSNHDFNSTANNNSYNVSLNLTIPEREVLDGIYEGYLKYNNTEGWITRLPISFNISAGTLIINESLENSTIRLTDNIGFNKTLILNITFNNTGSYPIYYTNTTSNFTLTKDTDSNISFSVDDWPSNPISPGSSGMINISFNISTNLTRNDNGIYRGWIFFNTTNTTLNSSSYPYKTFNLSLEINLTNRLDVRIIDIRTLDSNNWIENTTGPENITLVTRVYLINGTQLGDTDDTGYVQTLYIENFTSASIYEHNYTSYTSTLTTRSQQDLTGTDWLCSGTPLLCYVNYTAAAAIKGGRYNVSLTVTWNTGESTLTGTGISNDTLIIKDTGLELTRLTPSNEDFTIDEGANVTYFNVSVINYGPIPTSGGTITFSNNSCAAEIDPWTAGSNCTSTESGTSLTSLTVPGNATGVCIFVWKITSSNDVSSTVDCDYTVTTSNTSFNSLSGEITVRHVSSGTTDDDSSSSSSSSSGTTTGDTTSTVSGTTDYVDIIDYPTSISIEQGGSKVEAVTVNNTNKTLSQNVLLDIANLDSSWYSINPSTTVKLKRAESYTFEVTFNIPNNATVGDYSGKFNATGLYMFKTITKIYDTVLKDFTLKVTPGEALKSEIESKLSSYTNDMNALEQQINESKSQNYNTSEVESLFDQLKTKIDQANDYVDSGDYTSAYNLLDDIASLINQTKDGLTGLSPITGKVTAGDWWSWGKWVIIVVVVVVVSVIGYMLWPTRLGETKPTPRAIVQKVVEGKKDKIAETFMKLKERWKKVKEKGEADKRES